MSSAPTDSTATPPQDAAAAPPSPAPPSPTPPSHGDSGDSASDYRALHTGAIVGIGAAVVSLFFPFMVATAASFASVFPLVGLPIVALGVSLWGLNGVRAAREYYTGAKLAAAGILLAGASLVGGLGYGGYVYATEVPDGYARTSFLAMKPSDEDLRSNQPVPPDVAALRGKRVFIKGYMRPDSTKSRVNIKDFLLVRDNNQCCFGDLSQVAFFDQIQVELASGLTTDLSPRVYRVGGEIDWRPRRRSDEPPLVYSLKADYIK